MWSSRVLLVALASFGWLATACSGACPVTAPPTLLDPCATDADCASPLTCLRAGPGGNRVCTRACTAASPCPVVTSNGANIATCSGGFCGFLFCE